MKIKVSFVLFILLFLYSMNSIAQKEDSSYQYRPSIEFSAQRYEYFEDGQMKNFLGKNHDYCFELESGFWFRSSGTSWRKNFSVYFGYKEYNLFMETVRYNFNYLTHGYSLIVSRKINDCWDFEIPIDIRANFLFYSTREYLSNPGITPLYVDNYISPFVQIKTGVQCTYRLNKNINAGLFLKGGYALGSKYNDYPYVNNITAGDIDFHAFAGIILRYHL